MNMTEFRILGLGFTLRLSLGYSLRKSLDKSIFVSEKMLSSSQCVGGDNGECRAGINS